MRPLPGPAALPATKRGGPFLVGAARARVCRRAARCRHPGSGSKLIGTRAAFRFLKMTSCGTGAIGWVLLTTPPQPTVGLPQRAYLGLITATQLWAAIKINGSGSNRDDF